MEKTKKRVEELLKSKKTYSECTKEEKATLDYCFFKQMQRSENIGYALSIGVGVFLGVLSYAVIIWLIVK